jgi:hypothetical protein
MFLRLVLKLTCLHFMTKLFYDMQSEFPNKAVLPKKICEVHFITSQSIFSVALL